MYMHINMDVWYSIAQFLWFAFSFKFFLSTDFKIFELVRHSFYIGKCVNYEKNRKWRIQSKWLQLSFPLRAEFHEFLFQSDFAAVVCPSYVTWFYFGSLVVPAPVAVSQLFLQTYIFVSVTKVMMLTGEEKNEKRRYIEKCVVL